VVTPEERHAAADSWSKTLAFFKKVPAAGHDAQQGIHILGEKRGCCTAFDPFR